MMVKINPSLNLREVIDNNKYGRPLYKCKVWGCENLTISNRCMSCYTNNGHKKIRSIDRVNKGAINCEKIK